MKFKCTCGEMLNPKRSGSTGKPSVCYVTYRCFACRCTFKINGKSKQAIFKFVNKRNDNVVVDKDWAKKAQEENGK